MGMLTDYSSISTQGACYNLQYLDKTLVNYANVMGLEEDTGSMRKTHPL